MTVPTKNITSYFHAKTNSSHTHQAPDHEVLQHVLSSSDNDSDDECAYMYGGSRNFQRGFHSMQ